MSIKQKLVIAATVATIGVGSLGAGIANAATNNSDGSNTGTSIVDKLATKFGLNKADVQAVFDADRSEHEAQRLQAVTDKLAEGVEDGTITQAQSDAITAKLKELKAAHESNRDKMESMTDDERKAAMDAERAELKQWISDNDIPEGFVRLLAMGGHGRGGMGGPNIMFPRPGDSASDSDSTSTN